MWFYAYHEDKGVVYLGCLIYFPFCKRMFERKGPGLEGSKKGNGNGIRGCQTNALCHSR